MWVFYERFIRRDVLEKSGGVISDIGKVTISLSCKGLTKVVEVDVVKSLLLLEALMNCKGSRRVGLRSAKFYGGSRFNSFIGGMFMNNKIDIFYFFDKWVSIYGLVFFMEGGKSEVRWLGEDVYLVYYNINDYVEMETRFYRFKSVLGCRIWFKEGGGREDLLKGLGVV
jgi:hypothetical protein